jgi:hypothetical protein
MEITNCAARKTWAEESTKVPDQDPRLKWDTTNSRVLLNADSVPLPNSPGKQYDWEVSLSLSDTAEILRKLSEVGIQSDPTGVQSALQGHVVHLVRLLACAAGSVPGPCIPSAQNTTAND